MNIKRYIFASIAVFLVNQLSDAIIHSLVLGETYEGLNQVWRTDMLSKMWIMVLASVILAFIFTYLFTRGYRGTGILEGLRFGVMIGLLMNGVAVLQQYVIYPIPFCLAMYWFCSGLVQYILYGICAALIYKPAARL